mmetsp:Transcript_8896/g.10298  ORF Transcript_8896/g.10298 Transcript_8896/m.10298 type:complete len:105 (+) Transcript_8896:557-871(+)
MSSRDLPFVSGRYMYMNKAQMTHIIANRRKNPAHDMALAVERNVEAISVPVTRFMKVAIDIAFARMTVGKISAGISQQPGPIPTLKDERYIARHKIAIAGELKL